MKPHCLSKQPRIALLSLLLSAPLSWAEPSVLVVTDASHPVTNIPIGARQILLDEGSRLEDQFSKGLPRAPAAAAQIARQRASSAEGGRFLTEIVAAQQGVTDAWSLGITRIPAVVQDARYVVYGDADAAHALATIQRYRMRGGQ